MRKHECRIDLCRLGIRSTFILYCRACSDRLTRDVQFERLKYCFRNVEDKLDCHASPFITINVRGILTIQKATQ